MIDLVALRSLVEVDRLGSVGAAAQNLGYTPSAVSQQIKRLESAAAVPLLEKVGRGVVVTEAGRLLAEQAHDLLSRMEQLTARVQAGHDRPTGTLRIAAFATAVRGLLAEALARIGSQAPELDAHLVELDPWESIDALTAGQVDLAVVHNWEPLPLDIPAHVAEQVLGTDRADVLLPRDHPLAGRSRLGAAALAEERWVSVGRGSICDQWLTTMLRGVGAEPRIVHRSREFVNHLALVRAGVAVALVPRLGRPALPADVVAVPVRDPVPLRTVSVLWRRTMTTGPAIRLAVDVLATVAADRLQPVGHPAASVRTTGAGSARRSGRATGPSRSTANPARAR